MDKAEAVIVNGIEFTDDHADLWKLRKKFGRCFYGRDHEVRFGIVVRLEVAFEAEHVHVYGENIIAESIDGG
jgi:hypothetical protein